MTKTMRDAIKYAERTWVSGPKQSKSWCATAYWMAKTKIPEAGKPQASMASSMRRLQGFTRRHGAALDFTTLTTHPTHKPAVECYVIGPVALKAWASGRRAVAAPILAMFKADLGADHFRAVTAIGRGDGTMVAAFRGYELVGVAAPMRLPA